jgi:hypothetical protein
MKKKYLKILGTREKSVPRSQNKYYLNHQKIQEKIAKSKHVSLFASTFDTFSRGEKGGRRKGLHVWIPPATKNRYPKRIISRKEGNKPSQRKQKKAERRNPSRWGYISNVACPMEKKEREKSQDL